MENPSAFPMGEPNDGFAQYFVGQSYLAPVLETPQIAIHNVTFEPGCRNNWHVHKATKGGGQTLVCVGGRGYYQEWGKEPVELRSGDAINIPAGVNMHGRHPTAGSRIWPSECPVRITVPNGWNLSVMKNILN